MAITTGGLKGAKIACLQAEISKTGTQHQNSPAKKSTVIEFNTQSPNVLKVKRDSTTPLKDAPQKGPKFSNTEGAQSFAGESHHSHSPSA